MLWSIPVQRLEIDMQLGETIYNENFVPFIEKGKIITKTILEKINNTKEKNTIIKILPTKNHTNTRNEIKTMINKKAISSINSIKDSKDAESLKLFVAEIVETILKDEKILIPLENIKYVDEITYNHSLSVMINSIIFAKNLKLDIIEIEELAIAAVLHDLGKILIKQDIVNENGKLSDEARKEMNLHPTLAIDVLKKTFDLSSDILKGISQHHERIDGSGYPNGLKNDEIHLYAKIIGIVDVYDALLQKRSYKEACQPSEVLEYFYGASHLFDYSLIKTFLNTVEFYHIGEKVLLSNGEIGEIISIRMPITHKPLVKTVNGLINLEKSKNIVITKVLKNIENNKKIKNIETKKIH